MGGANCSLVVVREDCVIEMEHQRLTLMDGANCSLVVVREDCVIEMEHQRLTLTAPSLSLEKTVS